MDFGAIDRPFSIRFAPKYRVRLPLARRSGFPDKKAMPVLEELVSDGWRRLSSRAEKVAEKRHVLREAFRALREQYGDALVFSEPFRAPSFIYRSESALLFPRVGEEPEERFAWCIHFYQTAYRPDEAGMTPERYGGFVFVRPGKVHQASVKKKRVQHPELTREDVSPATCEGYLRLRISQELSPCTTHVPQNYAAPYDQLPFDSIPFYSPEVGKSCGHIAIATALTIASRRVQYSPYEVAAVHASIYRPDPKHRPSPNDPVPKDVKLCDGTTVRAVGNLNPRPREVGEIVKALQCPDVQVLHESCAPPKRRRYNPAFWQDFTSLLDTYIYMGLPMLMSINPDRLYADEDDEKLLRDQPTTRPERCHLILIHSLLRGTEGAPPHNSTKLYVISDTRNLHRTGSVFHKVTAMRLWASASRPKEPELASERLTPIEHDIQYLAVCVPKDFSLRWSDLKGAFGSRFFTLRDRSQLRGFLTNRVFHDFFASHSSAASLSEEVRKFRERLRLHDTSRYVWLAEIQEDKGLLGLIIDSRAGPPAASPGKLALRVRGVYEVSEERKQLDVWEMQGDNSEANHVGIRIGSGKRPCETFSEPRFSFEAVKARVDATLPPSVAAAVEIVWQ